MIMMLGNATSENAAIYQRYQANTYSTHTKSYDIVHS